jgi:hypothetical protein
MMLVDFKGNVSPAQGQFAWSSPLAVRPFQPLSLSLKGRDLTIYCWVRIGYMPIVAYHVQCIIQWIGDLVEVVQRETSLTVAGTEAKGWTYDRLSCISRKAWDTEYLKVSDFGPKPVQVVGSDDEA